MTQLAIKKLNFKQELFCKLYVENRECFGNATKSYSYAYEIEANDVCTSNASRLLRNDKVIGRINQLLDVNFKSEVVDRELMQVILQNIDLGAKMAAIREFNKVKGRISEKMAGEYIIRWADEGELKKNNKTT